MGKYTKYKVQLATLADGRYEQDFVCDTEFFKNMENPDIISADVNVHMDMVKKNEAYDCTFTCRGTLQVPCDRCLDPIDMDVDTQYHVVIKYGDRYSDEADDLLIIPETDAAINVAYMLADTIALTIPMRHVHPMGKCNRAMAAAMSKHRSPGGDEELDEELDEIDANPEGDDRE